VGAHGADSRQWQIHPLQAGAELSPAAFWSFSTESRPIDICKLQGAYFLATQPQCRDEKEYRFIT